MNDFQLDRAIRATSVLDTDALAAMDFTIEIEELAHSLVATQQRARRRHRGRWAAALVAAAVVTAALVLAPIGSGGGPEVRWAAASVALAESTPQLLLGDRSWKITTLSNGPSDQAEMGFSDGTSSVEMFWFPLRDLAWRTADARAGADEQAYRATVDLGAANATVIKADTLSPFVAFFPWGDHGVRIMERCERGEQIAQPNVVASPCPSGVFDATSFEHLLMTVRPVSVDEWLSAMPPSVVLPGDHARVVRSMLRDIPTPKGFDADALTHNQRAQGRYHVAAEVTGAVSCAWLARWRSATNAGDVDAAEQAARAMATSRQWAVLQEIASDGGWSRSIWQLADAMTHDGYYTAGGLMNLRDAASWDCGS